MGLNASDLPENHPVKRFFRGIADRALEQSSVSDRDLLFYMTDLLTHFMSVQNLYSLKDEEGRKLEYLIDMLQVADDVPQAHKKACYRQIGDYTLFMLGMFPESLSYGKRMISQSYYVDTGRRSYMVASELGANGSDTVVFKKLAVKYERCVLSLNWVREYTSDPFYQYMLRQFGITD